MWGDFISESSRLDRTYNGIIFKPHAIINDSKFIVDDRVFAGVRERLAHTNTSYNFNYIPIHVLGSIYERFLGKIIVTTDKRAKVVEKPEVRKAGGRLLHAPNISYATSLSRRSARSSEVRHPRRSRRCASQT